jgi:hypothetical protein
MTSVVAVPTTPKIPARPGRQLKIPAPVPDESNYFKLAQMVADIRANQPVASSSNVPFPPQTAPVVSLQPGAPTALQRSEIVRQPTSTVLEIQQPSNLPVMNLPMGQQQVLPPQPLLAMQPSSSYQPSASSRLVSNVVLPQPQQTLFNPFEFTRSQTQQPTSAQTPAVAAQALPQRQTQLGFPVSQQQQQQITPVAPPQQRQVVPTQQQLRVSNILPGQEQTLQQVGQPPLTQQLSQNELVIQQQQPFLPTGRSVAPQIIPSAPYRPPTPVLGVPTDRQATGAVAPAFAQQRPVFAPRLFPPQQIPTSIPFTQQLSQLPDELLQQAPLQQIPQQQQQQQFPQQQQVPLQQLPQQPLQQQFPQQQQVPLQLQLPQQQQLVQVPSSIPFVSPQQPRFPSPQPIPAPSVATPAVTATQQTGMQPAQVKGILKRGKPPMVPDSTVIAGRSRAEIPKTSVVIHPAQDLSMAKCVDLYPVMGRYDYWSTLVDQLIGQQSAAVPKNIRLLKIAHFGVWDPRVVADFSNRSNFEKNAVAAVSMANIIIIMNMLSLQLSAGQTMPHYNRLALKHDDDGEGGSPDLQVVKTADSSLPYQIQMVTYGKQFGIRESMELKFNSMADLRQWLPSYYESCQTPKSGALLRFPVDIQAFFVGVSPEELDAWSPETLGTHDDGGRRSLTLSGDDTPLRKFQRSKASLLADLKRGRGGIAYEYTGVMRFDDILQVACLSDSESAPYKTAFVQFVTENTLEEYTHVGFGTSSATIPGNRNVASVNGSMWDIVMRTNLPALLPRATSGKNTEQHISYALEGDVYDPFRVTQVNNVHILRDVAASGYAFLPQARVLNVMLCGSAPSISSFVPLNPSVHLFHILKIISFIAPAIQENANVIILGTLPDSVLQGDPETDSIFVRFDPISLESSAFDRDIQVSSISDQNIVPKTQGVVYGEGPNPFSVKNIFAPPVENNVEYRQCPYYYQFGLYLHFALRIPCMRGKVKHIVSLASPKAKLALESGYNRYTDEQVDYHLFSSQSAQTSAAATQQPLYPEDSMNLWDQLIAYHAWYYVHRQDSKLH